VVKGEVVDVAAEVTATSQAVEEAVDVDVSVIQGEGTTRTDAMVVPTVAMTGATTATTTVDTTRATTGAMTSVDRGRVKDLTRASWLCRSIRSRERHRCRTERPAKPKRAASRM
jgi:hypothetical protein